MGSLRFAFYTLINVSGFVRDLRSAGVDAEPHTRKGTGRFDGILISRGRSQTLYHASYLNVRVGLEFLTESTLVKLLAAPPPVPTEAATFQLENEFDLWD